MMRYIDPTFSLFGLEIAWYAVCILIGVVIAVIAGVKEGKKLGIPSDYVYWGVIIVLPCAIIGARLWYILFNLDQGWTFSKIIGLEGGLAGLAIQGGVIAALITICIYCYVRKISLYKILDIVAVGFLIGQICGRWGNFCNHELYGPVVENPNFLKLIPILGENMYINGAYRHPVFLYESCLNLVGLIILLILRRKYKNLQSGDLMGVYLVWYGMVRILTESLRLYGDPSDPLMIGVIPVSILFSVIFIIVGIVFLVVKRFVGPKNKYQDILAEIAQNKLDTIIFDLDGTLLDTRPLIDKSFIHTFEHFRPEHKLTDEELDSFFGPTLYQTFSRFSDNEEEIQEMIAYYREYNVANHDQMVKEMPGARQLLKDLHNKGYHLAVASSKKTDLVIHGLQITNLYEFMDAVVGADEVKNHKPAPDAIIKAIEMIKDKANASLNDYNNDLTKSNSFIRFLKKMLKKKPKPVEKIAYVGDTLNDMKAAKAANVKAIGCLYISHPEVMLNADVDYVIEKLSDIITICVE